MAEKLVTRAYNSFTQDLVYGTITKTSQTDRLVGEIGFYKKLPYQFEPLFPRLLDNGSDWMTLEYLDYPNLGSYLLSPGTLSWNMVLPKLHDILEEFRQCEYGAGHPEYARAMYIEKTEREYLALTKQLDGAMFASKELIINDGYVNDCIVQNFEQIWPKVREYIEKNMLSYTATFMHGDCCVSNILYSSRSDIFRFIDPRGEYGVKDVVGDHRYDKAKLYHSFDRGYEFIINDRFTLEQIGYDNAWYLNIPTDFELTNLFESIFFTGNDRTDIQILEGLIYVGMAARHYDSEPRQIAMYLTGVSLLNCAMAKV